jgi:hypothetical protein
MLFILKQKLEFISIESESGRRYIQIGPIDSKNLLEVICEILQQINEYAIDWDLQKVKLNKQQLPFAVVYPTYDSNRQFSKSGGGF